MTKTALIMAGGTGGHIFPGLAVALALRERGWRVHWLGGTGTPARPSMESQLVPQYGFAFEAVAFSGVRGKGRLSLLSLPWRIARACWQSLQVLKSVRPQVVLGLGGYISAPAGLMAALCRKPLLLHEQNCVAGMANAWLARVATQTFTAFPHVMKGATWVGNPLRAAFTTQSDPATRFAQRRGPLKVLVVGGSLGAQALNEVVPQALALLPADQRPQVMHQSGVHQIDALQAHYAAAGIAVRLSVAGQPQDAQTPSVGSAVRQTTSPGMSGSEERKGVTITPFIDDTAQAFADADLVICRAGASTVTELAAVGVAALLVPFPQAVDDHQTHNARYLADNGGAWLMAQDQLTPTALAALLAGAQRTSLLALAQQAKKMEKLHATEQLVRACEDLVS